MHWCQNETNAVIQNIGMIPIVWMEFKHFAAHAWRWMEAQWRRSTSSLSTRD